ncbi:MAG: hypothetical protein KGZ30_01435 [Anaplasmataceae bacterium]|nr:hypothetical protein [Anaplasmataceae bacterium]
MRFFVSVVAFLMLFPGVVAASELSVLQEQLLQLIEQVVRLQAELSNAQKVSNLPCYTLTRDLSLGASGDEVSGLHRALEQEGFELGLEKSSKIFGEKTASAVVGFQQKYAKDVLEPIGLQYGTGYFGKLTREKVNSIYGCGAKPIDLTQTTSTPKPPALPPSCDIFSSSTIGENQFEGCMWTRSSEILQGSPAGAAPSGQKFSGYIRTNASALNYDWSSKAPSVYVGHEHYSARWRGKFLFDVGKYKFTVGSDDGVRVYFNGVLQVNDWLARGPYGESSFPVELKEAQEILIQIDYRQFTGPAKMIFRWEKI